MRLPFSDFYGGMNKLAVTFLELYFPCLNTETCTCIFIYLRLLKSLQGAAQVALQRGYKVLQIRHRKNSSSNLSGFDT